MHFVTNISPIDRNEEEAYFSEPEQRAVQHHFRRVDATPRWNVYAN